MTSITRIRSQLNITIPQQDRAAYVFMGLWILTMIALPIARWIAGDEVIPTAVTIAAVMQASAVFAALLPQWGLRRTLTAFIIVAAVTWAAEAIGSRTGFPFGFYHYTEVLQPQIAGVPLLIPIAWFMLLPASWALAQIITRDMQGLVGRVAFVLMSAAALTAWDLFLDPQMVGWNFWQWDEPGGYFGIPWVNYFGWLLVSALVTILVRPAPIRPMPLVLVYGIVWFLQTVGQAVFWGQIGPAIVGSIAMGSVMVLAYWRAQRKTQ